MNSGRWGYLPAILCVAAACAVCWPAFAHGIDVWTTTEEFSFGFLVPVVSVFLVWLHRAELRRSVGRGADAGLIIVGAALLLSLFAHRIAINALVGLAVVPLLFGSVAFLWGWQASRVLAFPIGFLGFGLVLFRGLLDTLGFAMQGATAVGAGLVTSALGLGVAREGLVLRANDFAFVVAEPCSGMSSLVSLLALAALWTHVARGKIPARVAVLAAVLPIVLVANTTRVSLVLLIAATGGQEAALGFFHGASSLVLFGLALAGLLVVSRTVGCKAPPLAI
jgi:exosortase